MHELSIAQTIVETLYEKVPQREKLSKIHLTIGALSGVSADALSFSFSLIALEKGFSQAEMEFTCTPARLQCGDCGNKYNTDVLDVLCPQCGSLDRTVLSGNECTIDFIEVEE